MKIEKKKVVKSSKLSHLAKSAVAAALGIAASIGTTACDDSISAIGGDKKQEPEPTCGEVECGSEFSSSSYTDISSSGEHLSSEAIEALSSAKQPKSSSSIISAGIPHTYSSSSVKQPSSSSYEPPLQAGILPPYEDSSSSETPSSSSEEKSSSSKTEVPDPRITPVIDTLSPRIHLCEDPNDPRCLIESMVTTFEQDDIQA